MSLKRSVATGAGVAFGAFVWVVKLATVVIAVTLIVSGIGLAVMRPVFWIPVLLTIVATVPHFKALAAVQTLNNREIDYVRANEPISGYPGGDAQMQGPLTAEHTELKSAVNRGAKQAVMAGTGAFLAGLVIAISTDQRTDELFKTLAWGWTFLVFAAEMTWLRLFWGQGI